MYKNVKLILKDEDKNLKVKPIENYKFASQNAQCIVGLEEVFKACMSYPILFSKIEDKYSAMALFGVQDGKNLFVDDDGKFKQDEYIPAFFRRYPFTYIKDKDTLHLGYDSDCKEVNKKSGQALFEKDGKDSEYLGNILDFMNKFQVSCNNMEIFVKQLDDAGVLEEAVTKINDGKFIIKGFYRVSEEKLNKLDKESIEKLVKSGAYKLAIAHLLSYDNFEKMAKINK